jgi:glycosyltransferase involved in cell wall biosynthesis
MGHQDVHVAFVVDSLGSGGAQRQIVEMATFLHRRGDLRCTVLVYHPDDFYGPQLREADVPLVRIRKKGRVDPLLGRRIGRWLAQADVDLVHAFLLTPAFWSLAANAGLPRARRPVFVAAERNCLIATTWKLSVLQRLVYRHSDAVTVNAECAAREIRTKLGVPLEKLHYLPNGIDLARWDADAAAPSPIELEPEAFHLALVSGLRPQKGHVILLRALHALGRETTRRWRIWFVGASTSGARAARRVETEVQRLGLGDVVRFHPPVRNVAALLTRLGGVVLPSLHEGFPNVVLEAMASRTPVVATAVGDVPNLVEDGVSGLLAKTWDPDSLAERLLHLSRLSPSERRSMGEQARARVESRFSMQAVAQRYATLYTALVADRREVGAGPGARASEASRRSTSP